MAKYRTTDVADGQGLFLTGNLQKQLLPDSLEVFTLQCKNLIFIRTKNTSREPYRTARSFF